MLRRLLLAAIAAFSAFAAAQATTVPGAAFLLVISLAAIAALLRHATRGRSLPGASGLNSTPLPPAAASLVEQAEGRIGQPIQSLCPFELRAQDRPGERWQGSQPMWVALGQHTLWFLHDAPSAGSAACGTRCRAKGFTSSPPSAAIATTSNCPGR